MDKITFRDRAAIFDRGNTLQLFAECRPHVLVVTDGLNYGPTEQFGLTQFVNTLKASTIHGMTPKVTKANRTNDSNADLPNYSFTDPTHGLLKSRYDVVFLLGFRSEGVSPLPPPEVAAIAQFMEAGGGVFATGDHGTIGASLCGGVPRVRAMRKWYGASSPPGMSDTTRFSTNLSGPNESEEFSDQSNTEPQRLYVNYRTTAGGVGQPHPLLQLKAPRRVLEVFPDHPHEGQCVVPTNLNTQFVLGGASVPEWPNDANGVQVKPEIVAMSVSNGDGFPSPSKEPLTPALFASIVAYDGHRANKGRVSTDSTWHHFVNINLDGTGEPGFTGLQSPASVDTEALIRIRQYYVNLATWLMPKKVRLCLQFPLIIAELFRYPLFEELELPPLKAADAGQLRQIGAQLVASVARRTTRWEAQSLLADALEEAVGERATLELLDGSDDAGLEIAHAALGGRVTAIAERLAEIDDLEQIRPHETFDQTARQASKYGAKLMMQQRRAALQRQHERLGHLEGALAEAALEAPPTTDA